MTTVHFMLTNNPPSSVVGMLCDLAPEIALPYLAMQERQLTLEHADRERERRHRETVVRLEGAAHQATVQLELLRMLPERERGRAAARALRRGDTGPLSMLPQRAEEDGSDDTSAWDWTRECALVDADSQGLAGVWDASIAPALGVPLANGGGGARSASRLWRPTPDQVQRCYLKLVALREQVQPRGPGAAITEQVLQHLRSLHTFEDTSRVVRDLTACVRVCLGRLASNARHARTTTKRGPPTSDLVVDGAPQADIVLGNRQTRVVVTCCTDHNAFLEDLVRIGCGPGLVSVYNALRAALPAEYARALHAVHGRYEGLLAHLPRPARQCIVEAPQISVHHTIHFWEAGGEVARTLRDAVLEYAYDADDTLPVHRWFLYRPDPDPDRPLAPLTLSAFGFDCGDADDWASCFRRGSIPPGAGPLWSPLHALQQGLLTDEWVEVLRRGQFGVVWSALTGPVVCRLSPVDGLLLPSDEWNLPDSAAELWDLLLNLHERLPGLGFRPASGIYRLPLEAEVRQIWERATSGVAGASEPSCHQLWLCLNVLRFHPGYRFRFVPNRAPRVGLTPAARRACEDYLTGLVWIQHRYRPPQEGAAP